jgi:hypothetical protein
MRTINAFNASWKVGLFPMWVETYRKARDANDDLSIKECWQASVLAQYQSSYRFISQKWHQSG